MLQVHVQRGLRRCGCMLRVHVQRGLGRCGRMLRVHVLRGLTSGTLTGGKGHAVSTWNP